MGYFNLVFDENILFYLISFVFLPHTQVKNSIKNFKNIFVKNIKRFVCLHAILTNTTEVVGHIKLQKLEGCFYSNTITIRAQRQFSQHGRRKAKF